MHIVTGGAGFIGSVMVWRLNQAGVKDVWIVDELGDGGKWRNLQGLTFAELVRPDEFLDQVRRDGVLPAGTEAVVHLGACSSTTETDADYLFRNNFQYSRTLARAALASGVRFLNASSAAVYGAGEEGYDDGVDSLFRLRALNMYGYSKLLFDQWAARSGALSRLASLRFFNVYGPNEYHKGDMASMVAKSFARVMAEGRISLFRSMRPDFADGEQTRDFVYVKDVVDAMWWLLEHPEANGVFNIGSGEETSWNRLARAVFAALGRPLVIEYVDMPASIRNQYQYRTLADIGRLRAAGCPTAFRSVEEGVRDYVVNHLSRANPHMGNGA